jgi:integrase
MSFPAAAAEWERLREERDAGGDPALSKRQAREAERTARVAAKQEQQERGYTVRLLCDDYLAGHVDRARKPKGAIEVRRMFDTMLGALDSEPASTLTRRQCFDLLESLQRIPVQAAKLRAELGAAWDYALDAGRIPESTPNWWRQIMRGRLRSKGKKISGESIGTSKRALSAAEAGALIAWLPNFPRLIDDALTVYLWTLARGAEIMAMESGEISKEKDGWWWTVPKMKTKNARHANATDFRVPLAGRALDVIRRRMEVHDGYLFPSPGEGGHVLQKTIQTAVHYHQPYSKTRPEHARPRLQVTHWSPHDLRRTSRTFLTSLECPDDVGEAMLGHMQEGVKGIYNLHTYDKQRRVWINRLSAHLEESAQRRIHLSTSR